MDDLISRQEAIDAIHSAIFDFFDIVEDDSESPITYKDEKLLEMNKTITKRIRQLPSAERKGKWELAEDGWYCTACELYPPFDCDPEEKGIPFCPNCGADMRGEEV